MYNPIRQPLMAFWAFALLAISMLWGASAYAITPAGTVIKNLATVTYEDSAGNRYTAQSNESTVTVAEVYNTILEKDRQSKDSVAGQTVYFSHQLINNGNTEESFTLAVANGGTGAIAKTSLTLDDLEIYHDINGNGQPDSGEPLFTNQVFPVAAGTTANLVVAAVVPVSAVGGNMATLTLTATSTVSGADGGSGVQTNTDTINVTDDAPVLVTKKQVISHTPATSTDPGTVKYRIEVTNNGKNLAKGRIYDFFPEFIDLTWLTSNQSTDDSRLGDLILGDATTLKGELPNGTELVIDGDLNPKALSVDVTGLGSGSLAFEFEVGYSAGVDYAFVAGEELKNQAYVGYNVPSGPDDAPNPKWSKVSKSNITAIKLPQLFSVEISDDTVENAPMGGIVSFVNTITNKGNGLDVFNLTMPEPGVDGNTFPAGTTFTLWDETGNIRLSDSNGDGIPDTGAVAGKDGTINIMLKAQLPNTVNGNNSGKGFKVELTAASAGNATFSATATNTLDNITTEGNGVDLAHYDVDQDAGVSATPEVIDPGISELFKPENAHEGAGPISTVTLKSGKTAKFGLYIANESANSSSFSITSSIEGNPGWKVTYIHGGIYNAAGDQIIDPTEQIITNTPSLAGRTVMKVIAQVEVPANAAAKDGGYAISFTTNSNAYALTDTTNNKIVVQSHSELEFGPGGANQVEAGGIAFYEHQLKNVGNTPLTVTITGPEVDTLNGWNYLILNEDGTLIETPISLPVSSEAKNIKIKVLAPANAPAGYVFNLPLTAADGVTSATLTNTATIIKGQVVLRKEVAKVNADGSYDEPFATHLPDAIKPGEKVVWKVQAVVQGSAQAKNVIISDAAPPFTSLAGGTGNPKIGPVEAPSNQFDVNGSNITFYVGEGADKTNPDGEKGGILNPGQSVEVTFEVVIDE